MVKNGSLLLQIRQMKQKEAEQAEDFGHEWEDFPLYSHNNNNNYCILSILV